MDRSSHPYEGNSAIPRASVASQLWDVPEDGLPVLVDNDEPRVSGCRRPENKVLVDGDEPGVSAFLRPEHEISRQPEHQLPARRQPMDLKPQTPHAARGHAGVAAAPAAAGTAGSGAGAAECPDTALGERSPLTPRSPRHCNKIHLGQNEMTLRIGGQDAAPQDADRVLYTSVLKELMGAELRTLIRDELKFVLHRDLCAPPARHSSHSSAQSVDKSDGRRSFLTSISLPNVKDAELPDATPPRRESSDPPVPGVSVLATSRTQFLGNQDAATRAETEKAVRDHMDKITHTNQDDMYNTLHQQTASEIMESYCPFVGGVAGALERALNMIGTLEAPKRTDCVSRLADSLGFSLWVYCVIVLNCAFMVYTANEHVENYLTGESDLAFYGEYAFLIAYSFEFMVKFARYRLYYFYGVHYQWNLMDFIVLMASIYSVSIAHAVPNVSFLRMFRMFRMLRVLRVLRVITMFSALRAILKSLSDTMDTLFWSMVMICLIHFLFALLFVMRVASYFSLMGQSLDGDEKTKLEAAFGTVLQSFLTLLFCTNGGNDWAEYFEILAIMGPVDAALFLGFVLFAQIALLNIILGIFVDQAMKSLLSTKEEKAKEHAWDVKKLELDLRALCAEADADNSGRISHDEWQECVSKGSMSSYLDLSGFRIHDVQDYFQMCCNQAEDRKVDIETFVQGCMRLRGPASCFDMQAVLVEVVTLNQAIRNQQSKLNQVLKLDSQLHKTCLAQMAK